jgi:hypothetical protein
VISVMLKGEFQVWISPFKIITYSYQEMPDGSVVFKNELGQRFCWVPLSAVQSVIDSMTSKNDEMRRQIEEFYDSIRVMSHRRD